MILWAALAQAAPTFDVERGVHEGPFTLTLGGSDITYGLGPGEPDTPYTAPIEITGSTIVRAVDADGDVITHPYLFLDDVLEQSVWDPTYVDDPRVRATLADLPTVSVVTDGAFSTTEVAASFEYVEPGGLSVQEDCGVARVGGHSLNYAKNNLRLYFRTEYGAGTLDADFFEGIANGVPSLDEHDSLDLRGGSHDSSFYLGSRGQHLRNIWMDETELAMGHIAPHGRFVHVYLDGEYTGLYQLRERFDAAMLAGHLGGSEDDYGAVNGGRSVDGDGVAWAAIAASVTDFEAFRTWVDVEQYLDYIVLNLFAANQWDWNPYQNWMAAGPNTQSSGWIFHSSDSDICLWYDPSTYVLDDYGPSYSLYYLVAEWHPDFAMAMADALQRNLRGTGPLTSPRASDRYSRLAVQIEDAVVAEAARWGGGAWDPDTVWVDERDYLVDQWMPTRTDELLADVVEAGWLPLDAPAMLPPPGTYPPGTTLRVAGEGTVWIRLDGGDPRQDGGAVADEAFAASGEWSEPLSAGRHVTARLEVDGVWGPLAEGLYVVEAPSPLVLNEWNAVEEGKTLRDGDAALGVIDGNGGDWIELLVLQDMDLAGRITMWDAYDERGEIVLDEGPVLAGTIVTISEDLPADPAYDPEGGDWRFHLSADFDVTHTEWQLAIWDADDALLHGPVGEGWTVDGISSREVGVYAADPGEAAAWADADNSTYGAPNTLDGWVQDLSALRGVEDTGDTAVDGSEAPPVPEECGCGAGSAAFVVVGLLLWRRRRLAPLVALAGCASSEPGESSPPDSESSCIPGPEICNERDDDCDGRVDEDPVDGLPFYADQDGDGYGDQSVTACLLEDGLALEGGDCDDGDASIFPGAPESCDDVDRDCDGTADDSPGVSDDCPATSCEGLDGVVWLELASGAVTPVVCEDGWTLGFVRSSLATGSQGDFGSGDEGLGSLATHPSETDEALRGWHDLNGFAWSELVVAAYYDGAESYRSSAIPREDLRIDFGQDGYLLYGDYVWCGGDASYTDSGVGQVDQPEGAYSDCRGHGSLGSGWDFSESTGANQGLTLCGGDGSNFLAATWAGTWINYGNPGGAQAIWVR